MDQTAFLRPAQMMRQPIDTGKAVTPTIPLIPALPGELLTWGQDAHTVRLVSLSIVAHEQEHIPSGTLRYLEICCKDSAPCNSSLMQNNLILCCCIKSDHGLELRFGNAVASKELTRNANAWTIFASHIA